MNNVSERGETDGIDRRVVLTELTLANETRVGDLKGSALKPLQDLMCGLMNVGTFMKMQRKSQYRSIKHKYCSAYYYFGLNLCLPFGLQVLIKRDGFLPKGGWVAAKSSCFLIYTS